MILQFHPAVQNDFHDAAAYYEADGGENLADRFEREFRFALVAIKAEPTRFPFYGRSRLFRRIRLKSFPYLIVFRTTLHVIRIILLKHERRHPLFDLNRW